MKSKAISAIAIIATALSIFATVVFAAQDRFTLKARNGVAFSEFRGYETWQTVAVSQVDGGLKTILGNAAMIKAYREGIPANGKPFPEGADFFHREGFPTFSGDRPHLRSCGRWRELSIDPRPHRRWHFTNCRAFGKVALPSTPQRESHAVL